MKEIKGYGITAEGTQVDINSPNFHIQDYTSVIIEEEMSKKDFEKNYPELAKN